MTVKFEAEAITMHYLNGEKVNEEDARNIAGGGIYPSEIVDFCPVTWVFVIDLEDQLILVDGRCINEDSINEFLHPEEVQDNKEDSWESHWDPTVELDTLIVNPDWRAKTLNELSISLETALAQFNLYKDAFELTRRNTKTIPEEAREDKDKTDWYD